MGSCNQRVFLFTVCILQVISITERQIFDFLGYQWLPIAANFIHILLVIIGFFGGYQYRKSYLIAYLTWQILWLAWNSFVICYYLNIGVLNRDSDILNLGTGAASWWEVNGIGCRPFFNANGTSTSLSISPGSGEPFPRPPRPDLVDGCLVDYQYVEVIHAAIQCALAVFGFLSALLFVKSYTLEDDSYGPKPRSRTTSLYSVQYSSTRARNSPVDDELELGSAQITNNGVLPGGEFSKPMTPRRVKRRSVSRGSDRRQSNRSAHRNRAPPNGHVNEGFSGTASRNRDSQRRRSRYINPVNRLMEHTNLDSSTSNDSEQAVPTYYPSSNPNGYVQPPPRPPAALPPDPSNPSGGHSNPLYQSSRPNSVYTVSSGMDLDYRPPSAHSSYSNWHGQRPSMPLPQPRLHEHSPIPSPIPPINSFGVPATGQVATSSGYTRPATAHNGVAGPGRPPYGMYPGNNAESAI